MESIFSKTTLYDIMSMIIPGFIALLSLIGIFHGYDSVFEMLKSKGIATAIYILAFALSYLVGVLIHYLAHFLFYWFKDCSHTIRCAYRRYHKTLNVKGEKSDPYKRMSGGKIIQEYYIKYYEVVKPGCSVSMMEIQLSFLRSMFFVIPIGVRAIYTYTAPSLAVWWVPIITIIMCGAMFLAMYYIQVRLSFRVFEDYYYQKIIGEKDKKKAILEGNFIKIGTRTRLFGNNINPIGKH